MNLLRFQNINTVTLDFETCNLSLFPEINAPWQLGWQINDLPGKEDWIKWDDLMDKMDPEAAAITKFDYPTYLKRAKDPVPILEEFEKYLLDPNFISVSANGAGFDAWMYQIWRQLLGRKTEWSWYSRHYDIQVIEKAKKLGIIPPPIGTDDWVLFNVKMSIYHERGLKTNVAFLCKEYDVPYDASRHHVEALYDVELTYQIFQKQIRQIDIFI